MSKQYCKRESHLTEAFMWLLALPVAMSQTTPPRESLNKYSVHMMAILEYYFQYISFKNNYFAFSLYE